jgi:hypothetical protein
VPTALKVAFASENTPAPKACWNSAAYDAVCTVCTTAAGDALFISIGLSSGSAGCVASVVARPSHMKPPPGAFCVMPSGFSAMSLYGGVIDL